MTSVSPYVILCIEIKRKELVKMLDFTLLNAVLLLGIFVSGFILGLQWNDKDLD